ncbi:MAG: U32 family peptidase [Solobacterium sp.]|nr:U32 family peptidase [Solobacterium sp.]
MKERSSDWKKPELLAPAGDLDRCRTAIDFGADAVYIGGRSFSLRSRASNFTNDDIKEACAYAKAHGAAIHVTVNTIPHTGDFAGLEDYLKLLETYGVHAVIVASPAIMKLARTCAPGLEVHCSTQMSVTNAEAAKFLHEQLGIDRVVLARECTLDDVREITARCPVDTEVFIHGGMCVNYSGRCTLSNRMTKRDANRGGCAQSCRWQYRLYDENGELSEGRELFTMGSKDLCAAEYIAELMKLGVSSFKIEGRMKTEYYVASIVSAYRHLIDAVYENGGALAEEAFRAYRREIMKGENRLTWPGFYQGDARDSLITKVNNDSNVNHDFLGRVKSYADGTAVIVSRNTFALGDEVEVLSPGTSNRVFRIEKMKNENGEYLEISRHPMKEIAVQVPFEVHPGDLFRRNRI